MIATHTRRAILVEVEEALGPGLDYERDLVRGGIVVRGARGGGLWLGADRGFLVDSDDGHGREVPVLVALPASSFVGARIDAELVGGFSGAAGLVLVARLPGTRLPVDAVLRTVGRVSPDARWIDAARASERASGARRAFRERRGRGRITGGLAWRPPEGMSAEALRSGGVYSKAERSLDRLPSRFLRGLEGMLDPDERLHYSIDRPWRSDAGPLTRVRGGRDHRSGLLLLTDRQVLWLVDHSNPDSYLFDWGVDVDMVPVEQLTGVRVEDERDALRLVLQTQGGRHSVALPVEMEADVRVFESLASSFLPERNRGRLRRVYATEAVEFVEETAERFRQLDEARALREAARREAGDLEPVYELSSGWRPLWGAGHWALRNRLGSAPFFADRAPREQIVGFERQAARYPRRLDGRSSEQQASALDRHSGRRGLVPHVRCRGALGESGIRSEPSCLAINERHWPVERSGGRPGALRLR